MPLRKANVAPSDSAASYINYFFSLGGGVGGAVGWAVGWAMRAAWPGRTDIPARLTPSRPVSLTLTPLTPLLAPPALDGATLPSLLGTSSRLASLVEEDACCDSIFSAAGIADIH